METKQETGRPEPLNSETLDWEKGDGLIPAIVQHAGDGRVLMLGYMNHEALENTTNTGRVTFYSRSKKRLWTKGESSGNHLELVDIAADCDRDTLLIQARPAGPSCHTGTDTCFGDAVWPAVGFLGRLEDIIAARGDADASESYTARLLGQGRKRCAQKVGEEGVEVALAAVAGEVDSLHDEAADLVYHLLVCLHAAGTDMDAVAETLIRRHKER